VEEKSLKKTSNSTETNLELGKRFEDQTHGNQNGNMSIEEVNLAMQDEFYSDKESSTNEIINTGIVRNSGN
jgi:hypothetical protein